jgi:protein-S-isoprenylcysteine O-methyltransferase Ste14
LPIFIDKKDISYTQKQPRFVNFEKNKRKMHQKDKLKLIVVVLLVIIMGTTYYFVGKESVIMKSVAASSFGVWLLTLFFLNKKYK